MQETKCPSPHKTDEEFPEAQESIENALEKKSHSGSLLLNSHPRATLRTLSLSSFTQACSISSVSMIQTVSEPDEPSIEIYPTSSDVSEIPAMPTLPPEPNGKGSLACARSPLASTSHAECQPEVEVQHARFECTPRSEFTAISNNSTSVNPYGTRIGKNHSSYLLMYYMLTGIRSAVLKGEEKYTQIAAPSFEGIDKKTCKKRVKLSLENKETTGGCCSCSKRKSREFRDYAPIAFRFLRKQFFIDTEDYLVSCECHLFLIDFPHP